MKDGTAIVLSRRDIIKLSEQIGFVRSQPILGLPAPLSVPDPYAGTLNTEDLINGSAPEKLIREITEEAKLVLQD